MEECRDSSHGKSQRQKREEKDRKASKTSHYSQKAELWVCYRIQRSEIKKQKQWQLLKKHRGKNKVTASCSLDYLKSKTVHYNCISTKLKIKYEFFWLWVETNVLQSVSPSAETFSVYDDLVNMLLCADRHVITVNLIQPRTGCIAEQLTTQF